LIDVVSDPLLRELVKDTAKICINFAAVYTSCDMLSYVTDT